MTLTLTKRTGLLWLCRIFISAAIIIAVELYFLYPSRLCSVCVVITALMALTAAVIILPLYFRSYKITSNGTCLTVSKGVIIKSTDIMPFARLVLGAGYRTPLARLLGLEGVVLRAARGMIIIPELRRADAERLISIISGGNNE